MKIMSCCLDEHTTSCQNIEKSDSACSSILFFYLFKPPCSPELLSFEECINELLLALSDDALCCVAIGAHTMRFT